MPQQYQAQPESGDDQLTIIFGPGIIMGYQGMSGISGVIRKNQKHFRSGLSPADLHCPPPLAPVSDESQQPGVKGKAKMNSLK